MGTVTRKALCSLVRSVNRNMWFNPTWPETWFPDAFIGPMAQLINAIHGSAELELTGEDNLKTMALVDAAYQSAETHNSVRIADVKCSS